MRDASASMRAHSYLVVDIDPVEIELLDPCSHGIRRADGIRASGSGHIGRTECRDDKLDAGIGVLGLHRGTLARTERCPLLCLIPGSLEQ